MSSSQKLHTTVGPSCRGCHVAAAIAPHESIPGMRHPRRIDLPRPLEGTNNKIKLLQRQAFGYRDKEFFKLRLLGLHRNQHALVG